MQHVTHHRTTKQNKEDLKNGNNQQLCSSRDANGNLSHHLPAKDFFFSFIFFLQAPGPLMPYLNAIKLLKAFLRIVWDISSACSISKHRKVTGLEWEEKNKTKTNQLGFLVVRSNVILYLSSYLYCSAERCNYKQNISSKQTKLIHCRKCFPSLKPRCGTER